MPGTTPARRSVVMHVAARAAAIILCPLPGAWAQTSTAEQIVPSQRFDGAWNATIECPNASNPALTQTQRFAVTIKDGTLSGSLGDAGKPGFVRLFGRIRPDGSAEIGANGLSGERRYNIDPPRGTAFSYVVRAQFDEKQGSGRREGVTRCDLTFARQ